jgi:hypothetical protein
VPGFFVVVEQRLHGRGGECPDHAHDHVGGELALPVVVPALQNVLQFQLQLRASRSSWIISLASGVSAAKRSANSSISGRPFTFQVLVWV